MNEKNDFVYKKRGIANPHKIEVYKLQRNTENQSASI